MKFAGMRERILHPCSQKACGARSHRCPCTVRRHWMKGVGSLCGGVVSHMRGIIRRCRRNAAGSTMHRAMLVSHMHNKLNYADIGHGNALDEQECFEMAVQNASKSTQVSQ